jgi:glycine betaine/choline ABC-type transport system substrate-binding protein
MLLAVASCTRRTNTIVVGSKNFTESDLLAEILAQQIERRTSLHVERRLHLGGTFVCHRALAAGEIDAYVEYTGTALVAILGQRATTDPESALARVREAYRARVGAEWLAPLGFNNTFAMIVREADTRRLGVSTVSQAASASRAWRAGFGYEFMERPDGFAGLARTYGLRLAGPPRVMDLGLTYRALADSQVDLIAGNSTDGQIAALRLVALADDRHYFPAYQAVPVVRTATLERHPELRHALEALGGRIDEATMRRLNAEIDVGHRDLAAVAREFLGRQAL